MPGGVIWVRREDHRSVIFAGINAARICVQVSQVAVIKYFFLLENWADS